MRERTCAAQGVENYRAASAVAQQLGQAADDAVIRNIVAENCTKLDAALDALVTATGYASQRARLT